jgi:hypothetical protein
MNTMKLMVGVVGISLILGTGAFAEMVDGEPIRELVTLYDLPTLLGVWPIAAIENRSRHESDPTAFWPIQFEKHSPTLSRNPSVTTESPNFI